MDDICGILPGIREVWGDKEEINEFIWQCSVSSIWYLDSLDSFKCVLGKSWINCELLLNLFGNE